MFKRIPNGMMIHYEIYGKEEGYPLLFLHGNNESIEVFSYFFDKLKDYKLIFIDSRCHGESSNGPLHFDLMKEDILEFVNEMNIDRYSVIGFSDGAIISILMSLETSKIDKMFLIGPNLNPLGLTIDAINSMRIDYEISESPYLKLDLEEPNIDPLELEKVNSRAIIIGGSEDLIRREHLELINKSFKNSTMYILENTDHMIPLTNPKSLLEIIENELKVNVYYEDNHVIVVEKPVGILSQEDSSGDDDILTITKNYLKVKYHKPGNVYLGLVQRLDRNVSGLMVLSKTSKASARLNENRPKKTYLACAYYKFEKSEDTLINYISKDEEKKIAYLDDDNGKIAILRYKVLDYVDNMSFLDVSIETGRFHQIRFQLSNIGHPLYNDSKYNPGLTRDGFDLGLDAYKVEFIHPTNGKIITIERMPMRYPFNKINK